MTDSPSKYAAHHEPGSLPACHVAINHDGDGYCGGCMSDFGHSRRCTELSTCSACGEGLVRRERKLVCITAGCAKSTRKMAAPSDRPSLYEAAVEAWEFLASLPKAHGIPAPAITDRIERAIDDFKHVQSEAHNAAFGSGSLDDDAYAQATSHVLNWVAGEEHEPLDNMLEEA